MIISLLNQKGGVGKTTLTVNIAHRIATLFPKASVLAVDCDPQQSLLNWSSVREKPPSFNVIGMSTKYVHRDLPPIAKKYDYVFIDSPPRSDDIVRSCIMASKIVIIPCTPSPYDIWASSETVKLVEEAQIYKPKIRAFFCINRRMLNTIIGNETKEALSQYEVPSFENTISQRVVFSESAASGETVFDFKKSPKASIEIEDLVEEILSKI